MIGQWRQTRSHSYLVIVCSIGQATVVRSKGVVAPADQVEGTCRVRSDSDVLFERAHRALVKREVAKILGDNGVAQEHRPGARGAGSDGVPAVKEGIAQVLSDRN